MPPFRRPLAWLTVLLLVAAPLRAQSAPDTSRALIARMKSDLRNLVTAQEAHYAEKGAYARTLTDLGPNRYRASRGVKVEIVNAGSNAYGAVARTEGRDGSCVIHVGLDGSVAPRTDIEKKRLPEGEPGCDGDGITERARLASEAESRVTLTLLLINKLQERRFGRLGNYAPDASSLEGMRVPETVSVTIELAAAPNREPAFLAVATDSRYPGYSCVLASGWARFPSGATTLAEKKHAGGNSQIVCDTFK
ncbi:MAG: hypothetical protein K8S21_01300 [Gemmatimonadetes bacterium]|nr:hypothetical protein [Gemmatimonadota bacterium]